MVSSRNPSSAPAPVGLAPRRAALDALNRVLNRGEPLDGALERSAGRLGGADRGLAHALAAETLRRLPDLDALIDSATRVALPADAKARAVLRLALAQALALGTPPHAAIATALPLVTGGPKRLVHGVFGTLIRGGAALPDVPTLPRPVADRWTVAWGAEMVDAAARAIARPPPLDLTLRAGAEAPEGARRLAGWSARLDPVADVTALSGFAEGEWWVQDLAASLPARLLGAGEGRACLDLCAAPGGKTMQLADAGWCVTAVDRDADRLERLRGNLARVGLGAALVEGNAMGRSPTSSSPHSTLFPRTRGPSTGAGEAERADRPGLDPRVRGDDVEEGWTRRLYPAVLLDAPCTATGTFRRHPEVLHRATPRSIAEAAERQSAMIDAAVARVAPGGRLVYAVCSLERAEGEDQVAAALARHPGLALDPVRADELPPGVEPAAEGWLRTLPTQLANDGRLDGFFAFRVRREAV